MSAAELRFDGPDAGTLRVLLAGSWCLQDTLPSPEDALRRVQESGARRVAFDGSDIADWDSGLLTFLVSIVDSCRSREIELDSDALPEGARRLLEMAYAVPEREGL